MHRSLRPIVAVLSLTLFLAGCGWLNALIPDQDVAGFLGLGGDGTEIELTAASTTTTGVAPAAGDPTTVFVGSVEGTYDVAALADPPAFVVVAAITETVTLGDTVVVRHPGSPTGDFVVSAVALSGSVSVDGTSYDIPAGAGRAGLNVAFSDPSCLTDVDVHVCTYETASNLPDVEVSFSEDQIEAFSDLLRNGGEVSADLTVTLTLEGPGLPDDATITITVIGEGAVVEF